MYSYNLQLIDDFGLMELDLEEFSDMRKTELSNYTASLRAV